MQSIIDKLLQLLGFSNLVGTFHPIISVSVSLSLVTGVYLIYHALQQRLRTPTFNPQNKHCFITGGSLGLGKALAIQLAKLGAHVTIVARNEAKLAKALSELEKARVTEKQKFSMVSADVSVEEDVNSAIQKGTDMVGEPPYYVFACAGMSIPGYFLEQSSSALKKQLDVNVLGTAYTFHAAAKVMVSNGIQGKLISVSSIAGLMSIVGYSNYSASKYAVRGLCEGLRNEFRRYGIGVHCFFPGTILTPGFEEEQKIKPQITKDIEGVDPGMTPEDCSSYLIKGLMQDQFMITSDFLGDLFRCSTKGVAPHNNFLIDGMMCLVAWFAFTPWRLYADYLVEKDGKMNPSKKED